MPHHNRAHKDSPHKQAPRHLHRETRANREVERSVGDVDQDPQLRALELEIERIFENVARILLIRRNVMRARVVHHQPAHMRPQKRNERAVRIGLLIRVHMMKAMRGNPATWRVFHAAKREHDHAAFEPLRHLRTLVRKQSVIAERDRLTKDEHAAEHDPEGGPTEEVGQKREQRGNMQQCDRNRIEPVDFAAHNAIWKREPRSV